MVERKKWRLGQDWVKEQLHDQLLQWMKMSSDFQQVGNNKPEAVALGLVKSIQQSGAEDTFCWFTSCSGGMLTQLLSK